MWIEPIIKPNFSSFIAGNHKAETASGFVYSNCAYACRYCNNVRRDTPVEHPSGARLLDPWRDAWGEHFRLVDDRLEPTENNEGGKNAYYTEQVYRLNDQRKVRLRKLRRELITDRLRILEQNLAELRQMANRQSRREDRLRLLALTRQLAQRRQLAIDELRWRTAIPIDAPTLCRCNCTDHHALPPYIPVQTISC